MFILTHLSLSITSFYCFLAKSNAWPLSQRKLPGACFIKTSIKIFSILAQRISLAFVGVNCELVYKNQMHQGPHFSFPNGTISSLQVWSIQWLFPYPATIHLNIVRVIHLVFFSLKYSFGDIKSVNELIYTLRFFL